MFLFELKLTGKISTLTEIFEHSRSGLHSFDISAVTVSTLMSYHLSKMRGRELEH